MVDAAIGAAIEVVLGNVLSLANDRIDLVLGFKEELDRLSKTAERIQGFVADADDKKDIPGVLGWLKDLEGEVFKAENVLDEVNYENLRRQVKYRSQLKRKVCFCFSFFSTFGFRSGMALKIRDINTNLKRINQEAYDVGLVTRCQTQAAFSAVLAPAVAARRRQADSVVVPNVVGRANDESKIMEMLLSPSDKVVSVIPIFGPPGLGKTTLAKSVYNNPQMDEHFGEKGKKVWVCVAKEIEIVELFKLILESLSLEKVELDGREAIVQKIKKELEGKRFFLVLDDVWNQDQILWDEFFNTLKGLNPTNGSWCLVTTRLKEVADAMSVHLTLNDRPYNLQKLTEDECWSIIKAKVIAGEEIPSELKEIKKEILRRCDGLPLAATLFGSLLRMNRKEWPSIVQKRLLDIHENGVKQVIKVSFDHLSPASVKKCFAYCSIFPQDTALEKDLLIELWMAEGFLQPDSKNERLMEDIGDNYFRILLQSSLLEEVNERWRTYYKMHDLVHDFAKSALNEDRYLALTSSQGTAEDIVRKNSTSLRTLFLESSISGDLLSKFECLHVLKLSGEDVKELPACVGELIHLRVLDISNSGITILPESLCKLYNLQTMRIKDGQLEEGLPKQMSNLISLRHLHYNDSRADFQMPSEMGRLTRLQTLKFFSVGQGDGCGIEELGTLKDLKGSLEMRNLELVTGKEGAEKAKLFEKSNLSMLTYLWGSGDRDSNNCDENIFEGLQPPQNLENFAISNFMGDRFPGWFINLSKLVDLKFTDCKRCRELPALGQLPSLERLELRGLENIRSIGLSFYGIRSGGGGGQVRKFFPALKYLSLANMVNLVEWKDEDEVKSTTGAAEVDLFPVLENLNIKNCSRLTSAPSHFPSIESLNIQGSCHVLLLKNILGVIASLSHLVLTGNMSAEDDSRSDEHIGSLSLVKRRHNNNLEEDFKCDMYGCGSLHSKMLEHLYHLPSFRSIEIFLIYDCDGLTSLSGEMLESCASLKKLEISCCHELTSLPSEMLESCVSLQELRISLCNELTGLPGEMLESCASLQKLNIFGCNRLTSLPGLESCISLQELKISDCDGLTSLPGLKSCTSLQELKISGCHGLISLPDLKSCTSLRELKISGGYGLTSLPGEMLESCASLQKLKISCCLGLTSLPGEMLEPCASLQELMISGCCELTSLPGEMLESCASLQELKISGCCELTSLPGEMLEPCASLQELKISCCCGLTSLPDEMLEPCVSLRILKVDSCSNLVSFPHDLQKTPSLEILDLSGCPELMVYDMSKGFGFLTSLRELGIGPFSSNETNEEFDWSELISAFPSTLTSLRFHGLPHVESLPEQLQYLTSLTEFHLEDFGIEALPDWIGNLASLERLNLWKCQKLRYLPSMAVKRCLTKFTSLEFYNCPLLEESCKSGTNSEWRIICQEWDSLNFFARLEPTWISKVTDNFQDSRSRPS